MIELGEGSTGLADVARDAVAPVLVELAYRSGGRLEFKLRAGVQRKIKTLSGRLFARSGFGGACVGQHPSKAPVVTLTHPGG